MRWLDGIGVGALVAASLAVAPAIGASDAVKHIVRPSITMLRGPGSFTPASADPRLAAIFARAGFDTSSFHFTPSEPRRNTRAVSVAVQAHTERTTVMADRSVTPSTVALAPISYNLGVAVGWRRFALSGDVTKVDLAGMPGSREAADVAVSYAGKRFTGQVKAAADRPVAGGPRLVEEAPAYSVDVGGSYRLTRNLDLSAGVRYKAERSDRLAELDASRRDSQAVYVGTAFRF